VYYSGGSKCKRRLTAGPFSTAMRIKQQTRRIESSSIAVPVGRVKTRRTRLLSPEVAGRREVGPIWLHPVTTSIEIPPGGHVLGVQHADQPLSRQLSSVRVYFSYDVLEVPSFSLPVRHELQPADAFPIRFVTPIAADISSILPLVPMGDDLNPDGAVTDRDAVLDPDVFCYPSLKFLYVGTVIREPSAVEDIVEAAQERFGVPEIRSTDVERLIKLGLGSEDR
jgi:hypothetical protein